MSDQLDDQIDFLIELARKQGAAVTSTTDGHIFILRKDRLRTLLENNESDVAIIFVKKENGTPN